MYSPNSQACKDYGHGMGKGRCHPSRAYNRKRNRASVFGAENTMLMFAIYS